jgi:hypothetical protein
MTEQAPWEGRNPPKDPPSGVRKPAANYRLPPDSKLPDVYKADGTSFIAPSGNAVARPPIPPRKIEKLAQLAMLAMVGALVLGILGILFAFFVLDPQAGVIRYAYAAMGAVIGAIGLVGLIAELPRMSQYRTANFMPGVLVFGSKAQMEKVAGPAGLSSLIGQRARGSGKGLLNLVFDRSAKLASPPEVVAIHCDRGMGPELVGIEWDAVRELQRGDIVWFHIVGQTNYLMFHKFIPYAPRIITDAPTRAEIFTALKVGTSVYKERPAAKPMGDTKVLTTDADGKVVAAGARPAAQPSPSASAIPLKAQGSFLGSADQLDQGDEPDSTGPSGTHIYKPEGDTDRFERTQQSDTEKVAKPWAEDDVE